MDHKTVADSNSARDRIKIQPSSQPDASGNLLPVPTVSGLLNGGGEMGERVRAFHWSQTPLGSIDLWSPALLTTVRLLLANRFPLLLWWGPQYISIYNDAYIPILGKKHPWALGQPVHECWKEIYHILQPLISTPFHGGPATWDDDIMLEVNRNGFTEETHFTIAYSPVPDETAPNGIGGVLATVNEITEKVVGERRIAALRDLGARVGEARTAEEACAIAAHTLAGHDRDVPFALLYLIDGDGRHARLAGAAGVPPDEEISPAQAILDAEDESGWPLAVVKRTGSLQVVDQLQQRFSSIPPGPWSDPPDTAVVMPIPSNRSHEPAGLLVAGLSPRLKLDQLYQDFIELMSTQIATAIANARVYEEERRRAEALAGIDRIRREAEKVVQYRSAQFETLLNQAPIGVYLVDADFRIREVNPKALPVFANIPDLIGRDFREVIHMLWRKEYADEVEHIFRHTLRTGEAYESPEQIDDRIDQHRNDIYEWRLNRIVLPDGRFGVVCYLHNISAQVRARARLAESEQRYRGIVDQSVGAIAEADPSGRFITVNDRFCEMTGYRREELLTLRILDLTHSEDLPRSRELLARLATGGVPYEIEKRYIRKDGSVIWVHKSVSAIRDAHGSVQSLIAVVIDITRSKQAEMALQQLNLQLENMVQDRTAELRAANESLREEIAERIRVEAQLSLHRDRLSELSRRLVEVQEEERRAIARELHDRAGQTLSALNINLTIMNQQLSPDSRLRIGERMHDSMKLATEVIALIRAVVSDLRPTVLYDYGLPDALAAYIREYETRYGIQVSLERPGTSLPNIEPGVAMTVLRILQEALINVVRHARADRAQVSLQFAEKKLYLTVQDNGVGIADIAKASRFDSHGLRIMRERAEAYGGSVQVGPAPGQGTRVEAFIPIQNKASLGVPEGINHSMDI